MPPRFLRGLFVALGAGFLAGRWLAADWLAETAELAVLPVPHWTFAAALLAAGAAWAVPQARRGWALFAAVSAALLALLTTDALFRLDPLPWTDPGLEGLTRRVFRNARLHVRPGLYGLLGVATGVGAALLAGLPRKALSLAWGDPGAEAVSLGGGTRWGAVLARLAGATAVVLVAFLFVRGSSWDSGGPAILVPIAIGMALTAISEETLFRGLLRPLAERAIGSRAGNSLQALLFGALHLSPTLMLESTAELGLREAVRFGLWVVLGWFFGLAARDTRGLAVPMVLHTVLGVAIYVTLVFRPEHGFVG